MIQALVCMACFAAQDDSPKPTPEHEVLRQFEGTWEGAVKFHLEPGKEPAQGKGTMVEKIICGGLWLSFDWEGEFMQSPFTGHGVMGYDPKKKKYVSVWVDSMVTSIEPSEGTYDEKTKTFTMIGEYEEAKTGKRSPRREVTEFVDKDTHRLKFYFTEDGKEALVMEIEFKRKK